MIKNAVAWIKSIYWLPIFAIVAVGFSGLFALTATWLPAIYFMLAGVFLVLLRIGDQ